jgi:hypothetical protein
MRDTIDKHTRTELLRALRQRYRLGSKQDKAKILDEFVAVAGCHRKHAIRLLIGAEPAPSTAATVPRRTYDDAVCEALIVLWEAADRICGKRLKAVLPDLIASLERHGHLALDPAVRQRVLAASAATIDRLLAPVRGNMPGRKRRKKPTKPSQQVPIRTFADWKEPLPGYLEIDFVSHGGSSMQGNFLWSLVATDVCSGWTEAIPLLAREQSLVAEGLTVIRRQIPIPVLGIDSDNDSAFINETLLAYCQEQKLEFTRSRAYQKNDQAWVEQKNGAVVRRFVGYDRLAGVLAGQCLSGLLQVVRLYVNHFQPSFKLRSKTRQGAKVKRPIIPRPLPALACWRIPGSRTRSKSDCGQRGRDWICCTAYARARRLWQHSGRETWGAVRVGRAWNSSWPGYLSCGGPGRRGRRTGLRLPSPAPGERGRNRLREFGRRSCCGCRKLRRPQPSPCSSGWNRSTRGGSQEGSYGPCSAASGNGVGSWPVSWCTAARMGKGWVASRWPSMRPGR